VPAAETTTRIFDFDPLAELPDDLHETTLAGISTNVRPAKDTYHPHELFGQVEEILQAAAIRTWTETTRDLVADLNAIRREVPEEERADAIDRRLRQEDGHVFRLLAGVAKWAPSWYPGEQQLESVRRIRRLVSQSRTGPKSVAVRTWKIAALVRQALAKHLAQRLTRKPIQAPELRAYFDGLLGHLLAIPVMAMAAQVPLPTVSWKDLKRSLRR
jgi:hypothetical protein